MPEVPETKYDRDQNRFDCSGLDLNRPVDSVKKGKFPYLKNVRSYQAGRVEPRFGMTDIAEVVAGQSPVHSCRRLNDPNAVITWARIVGTGTHLAYGQAAFTDIDSGYSGDPLALQPWKPQASPTPYMYVADRLRMRKVTTAGVLDTIGYAAPSAAPGVALSNSPQYKLIDAFDATTGWVQALTAAAPTLISRTPGGAAGLTTPIAQILYDTEAQAVPVKTGWACVSLTSMVGVGYGERLLVESAPGVNEFAFVQAVFPASKATTIASIIYDSGTSGLCSIVLTDAIEEVAIDAMIRNTTIGENARIVAVTTGPTGLKSIRLWTSGTWAVTNAIGVLATLRMYLVATYASGGTNLAFTDAMRSAITAGTGTLSKIATLDLSVIASGVPSTPDDYMCIGLRVDRPDLVTELKVQLDVDSASIIGGPAFSGTEFTRNFYTKSFRASDLTPSVRNLQPIVATQQTIAQHQVIDEAQQSYAEPPLDTSTIVYTDPYTGETITGPVTTQASSPIVGSQQLESGDVQWVGLRFHLAELIRVGTDDTRTLKDVNSIRVLAIVTGNVTLDMDSWWIGGGYGPDTGDTTAIPYSYRYRVRNPATNVRGNPSPATRLLVSPYRQSVAIIPTQFAAPTGTTITATNLVLDIERFGGQIAEWHYAGTVPNSASPGFIDTFADDIVGGNPIMGINDYELWPILGTPVTGTTGLVSGTSVADAGTTFNLSWAMGTRILIANQPYTIYRVISTALLEIVENAGSQTGVTWRIDEPTILAQPLPCLWIHDDTFFGCGDLVNPGRLYWGNPGSETADTINYRDVTSPSEPLMNGVSYNIRAYVFSSENLFQILRSTSLEAISENVASANIVQWISEKIPNGKGLFARWALTRNPTPVLCFLAKDGIYATTGGSPQSLTDEDLYPLFPNEGNLGTSVNGVYAPNIVETYLTRLRLEYYDDFLYFDYWHIPVASDLAVVPTCPVDQPVIGVPYSYTFTATGGTPPYTWSATGLPTGITMGASTGTVSGTATVGGTFPYVPTATDSEGNVASINCEFVIAEPVVVNGITEIAWSKASPTAQIDQFYILPPERDTFYRSTKPAAGSYGVWATEAMPAESLIQFAVCNNTGVGIANPAAFAEDARFAQKPRGTSPFAVDEAWVSEACPQIMGAGLANIRGTTWAGGGTGIDKIYTIGADNILYGAQYGAAAFKDLNPFDGPTVALPTGPWRKVITPTVGERYPVLIGDGKIIYWAGDVAVDWTEVTCADSDLLDICDSDATGGGFIMVAVGLGDNPVRFSEDVSLGVWTAISAATLAGIGWEAVRPRVAYSPYMTDAGANDRGTFMLIGGKVGSLTDVCYLRLLTDFTIDPTPVSMVIPNLGSNIQWRGIASSKDGAGAIIAGNVGDTNADIKLITNICDVDTYDDWVEKTLAEAPF